jgi:hypothetical protein
MPEWRVQAYWYRPVFVKVLLCVPLVWSPTVTAAEVGGLVAEAVNSTSGRPAALAVTVWEVSVAPSVCVAVETPSPLVTLVAGSTLPPPEVTAHVTETPGTPRPFASRTTTR